MLRMTFKATFAVSFLLAAVLGINLLVAAQENRTNQTTGQTNTSGQTNTGGQNVSGTDRSFIMEVAHNGMMEVELANLALQKSTNEDVKRFAQRMIDDHTAANQKLMTLAQSKGITLPAHNMTGTQSSTSGTDTSTTTTTTTTTGTTTTGTTTSRTNEGSRQSANIQNTGAATTSARSGDDRKMMKDRERLSQLSGAEFDREYMQMMVKDHKKAVDDFQKQSTKSKDADVQEFARTTLPTLQEHLTMARDIESKVGGRSGSK